jgi:hypothetical protein
MVCLYKFGMVLVQQNWCTFHMDIFCFYPVILFTLVGFALACTNTTIIFIFTFLFQKKSTIFLAKNRTFLKIWTCTSTKNRWPKGNWVCHTITHFPILNIICKLKVKFNFFWTTVDNTISFHNYLWFRSSRVVHLSKILDNGIFFHYFLLYCFILLPALFWHIFFSTHGYCHIRTYGKTYHDLRGWFSFSRILDNGISFHYFLP